MGQGLFCGGVRLPTPLEKRFSNNSINNMPEVYTDIISGDETLAVGYDELVPRFYKTVVSLSAVVSRDEKRGYGLRRISRGHNTGRALIEFDSLPAEIRDKIGDPRLEKNAVELYYRRQTGAERYFAAYMLPSGKRIKDELQRQYAVNVATVEAVLKLREERSRAFARCGRTQKSEWEGLVADLKAWRKIQQTRGDIPHTLPTSEARLRRILTEYAAAKETDIKAAYRTLLSGKHGNSNSRKVGGEMMELFESLYAKADYKPNYEDVFKTYNEFLGGKMQVVSVETGEMLNPAEYEAVSASTIRRYLTMWASKAATLRLRTGDRQKLTGETKAYHSMAIPEWAGSIISVDDRQPPFEYAKGERVWFYLAYDLGADCYTTIVWGKDKQGIILDFYRQMVRNYAEWGLPLPAEIECESNLNASYRDTFLAEGNMFEYVRIEANNARGKKIENRNRAMRYGDERKSEGWIARPFAKDEANRAGTEKVPMLPYDTIIEQTLDRYNRWNNGTHPLHPEMSRWEFFLTRQNPQLQPINWFGIIPHLGYRTKTSCRTGIVKLNYGECLLGEDGRIATGDKLIMLMKLAEGEELEVRWLDGNDGKVLKAYAYIGEQYICELLPKPVYSRARIEMTDADREARELMSKYVATVEGFANRRKNEIARVTVIATAEREKPKYSTIPQMVRIQGGRKTGTKAMGGGPEILQDTEEFAPEVIRTTPRRSMADRF